MIKKQNPSESWQDYRCVLEYDNQIIFNSSALSFTCLMSFKKSLSYSDLIWIFFYNTNIFALLSYATDDGLWNISVLLCKCSKSYKKKKRLLKLTA